MRCYEHADKEISLCEHNSVLINAQLSDSQSARTPQQALKTLPTRSERGNSLPFCSQLLEQGGQWGLKILQKHLPRSYSYEVEFRNSISELHGTFFPYRPLWMSLPRAACLTLRPLSAHRISFSRSPTLSIRNLSWIAAHTCRTKMTGVRRSSRIAAATAKPSGPQLSESLPRHR
jgi:hypothetical protein